MKKVSLVPLLFSLAILFLAPHRIQAAPGDLYVADTDTNVIFKFTPDGKKTTFASLQFSPYGLAFSSGGDLLVGGFGSPNILDFNRAGQASTFADDLQSPYGLAFDGAGNLFAADAGNGSIFKFTPSGTKTVFASGLASYAVAFDPLGNLFASDHDAGTIYKFTPEGSRSTFASGLNTPVGLAFDRAGNLFVAEEVPGHISKFSPAGVKSFFTTEFAYNPFGLAFDDSGNLFVSDANGMISKYTPEGVRNTFAAGLSQQMASMIAIEPATDKLRNISTRGFVQTGDSVLIGGFIVGGSALFNNVVLIRAIGPSLATVNVSTPLQDPILELHDATGAVIATNDDWQDIQKSQITATGLAPTDPKESAIYAVLPTGAYTAIVRGVSETTGNALVEVYVTE